MTDICPAISAIEAVLASARCCRHRRLVVLAGSRRWSAEVLRQLLETQEFADGLWVGSRAPVELPAVAANNARSLLGRDLDLVAYDCWAGLNPDALAAVAGTVVGGGLLVLLAPGLAQWHDFADPDYRRLLVHPYNNEDVVGRFLRRFVASIVDDDTALLLEEGKPVVLPAADAGIAGGLPVPAETEDQRCAVEAVVHVLQGHSRRPLVMTSDRGRGKSSALGIACARIMQSGCRQLVVTAPGLASVAPVFYHAARELKLNTPAAQTDHLVFGDAALRFVAPDELLRQPRPLDLLMVDEAAAIPAPLLEGLLSCYNRVVFSTTVHGYEGTGRGFDVRFRHTLRQRTNQVRELRLTQPIRWAAGDPVERWLYDALLLDAAPADIEAVDRDVVQRCVIEAIDRDQLMQQPGILRELFGLLVLAHYRTTPADLRSVLDGPNIAVWLIRYRGRVAGAALVAEEGGFDEPLAGSIWRGERRPRGHLLAQTLSAHAGFQEAALLRYWRMMRIAVHPHVQRRGVGGQLLRVILERARHRSIDLVGSSFAATADVLAFWQKAQYVPVRLGVTRDASSGCHSAVVLSALTPAGEALLMALRARFAEQFPRALEHRFRALEDDLAARLLAALPRFDGYRPDQQDWVDIRAFAEQRRQFEDCRLAIWKLVLAALEAAVFSRVLERRQQQLLVKYVLQGQDRESVCAVLGFDGRKILQQSLRSAVDKLYRALIPGI